MVLTLRNNLQSDVNLKYMECLWSLKRAINIILWVVWAPSWYVKNNFRRLQLPVHTRDKNMFCWPIKIQSFENQTSEFTCPLGDVLARLTQMIVADLFMLRMIKRSCWYDLFTNNNIRNKSDSKICDDQPNIFSSTQLWCNNITLNRKALLFKLWPVVFLLSRYQLTLEDSKK